MFRRRTHSLNSGYCTTEGSGGSSHSARGTLRSQRRFNKRPQEPEKASAACIGEPSQEQEERVDIRVNWRWREEEGKKGVLGSGGWVRRGGDVGGGGAQCLRLSGTRPTIILFQHPSPALILSLFQTINYAPHQFQLAWPDTSLHHPASPQRFMFYSKIICRLHIHDAMEMKITL